MKGTQSITFLDTPGHAAFSAMRKRGANVTDIAIVVVAADDGVMPQTKEAIKFALEAKAPIIIAITKCDKYDADPEKVKNQLLQEEIAVEELGGDVQCVEISAKTKSGLDSLKENILLLGEILELKVESSIPAEGYIIESKIVKGKGPEASILVSRGTLEMGDILVAGNTWCKVKSMNDEFGNKITSVQPGKPALITGWKSLPSSGDMALCCESEAKAKKVVAYREKVSKQLAAVDEIKTLNENISELNQKRHEEKVLAASNKKSKFGLRPSANKALSTPTTLDNTKSESESEIKTVSLVIKADTYGTLEAVTESLKGLDQSKVKLDILDSSVGNVSEFDIKVGSSVKNSTIICFNVKYDKQIATLAKKNGINIQTYTVIYKLLDQVVDLMESSLDPIFVDEVSGEARVLKVFSLSLGSNKTRTIAGSRVLNGSIGKNQKVNIIRNKKVIFTSTIDSLKQEKTDTASIGRGQDCGIGIQNFDGLLADDIIQFCTF
ncbi:hypothetical protein BB560_001250 [Smittium megazygosporum]|uniref:Tr-type G domain-containing protein n=1 Tax=Smittium megazygosporum TaxID=133381 RepID=A0A2T9ZI58_9FUNG|nr:hypothetical protein BB560_001250 [Smittium megazygosporum]